MKAPKNRKKAAKKGKQKLPREIIATLANLLAIDLAKAKLTQKQQQRILEGLGKLLTVVDTTITGERCDCYVYGHYVGYILKFNCIAILGGVCG
jgi:hypothetical protein